MKKPIVILENGGSTIKVGLVNRGRGKDPRYRLGAQSFPRLPILTRLVS